MSSCMYQNVIVIQNLLFLLDCLKLMRKKFDVYNPELCLRREVKLLSRVQLFASPWTVAYQAPPSMGFSRQECWSGLPFRSAGDLPDPGIEPGSPALQADALSSEPPTIALTT